MATYNSELYRKGIRYRATRDGAFELSASIRVPAGKALAASDVLNFITVGPGVDILEVSWSLSSGLFDGAAGTVDLGTDADPDNFATASAGFQSGARNLKIERASFQAVFNPSVVVPATVNAPRAVPLSGTQSTNGGYQITAPTGTRILRATIVNAGTQTNSDDVERIITMSAKLVPLAITTPTQVPYDYLKAPASHGLVSP